MALADIIERIAADGANEAKRLIAEAEARAGDTRAQADGAADAERDERVAAAERDIDREASRIVVSARLEARDESVVKRRALLDEALKLIAEGLASLPDERYATYLAEKIAAVAAGGEELLLGSADKGRAKAVEAALAKAAPELKLQLSSEAAPFDRGAMLRGDRVQADLSLAAIVDEQRDDLELVIASVLFGEGD